MINKQQTNESFFRTSGFWMAAVFTLPNRHKLSRSSHTQGTGFFCVIEAI
jgi:hypothetical protein